MTGNEKLRAIADRNVAHLNDIQSIGRLTIRDLILASLQEAAAEFPLTPEQLARLPVNRDGHAVMLGDEQTALGIDACGLPTRVIVKGMSTLAAGRTSFLVETPCHGLRTVAAEQLIDCIPEPAPEEPLDVVKGEPCSCFLPPGLDEERLDKLEARLTEVVARVENLESRASDAPVVQQWRRSLEEACKMEPEKWIRLTDENEDSFHERLENIENALVSLGREFRVSEQ